MLITKGQSHIDLPDDWTQTDEKNTDYFEAPDGARGLYLTAHEKNDLDRDRQVLEFVLKVERDRTRSMKGYKFRSYADSVSTFGEAIVGYLDRYDPNKNYRIVSKCIVIQQKIFRAVLHDYDCEDYGKSKLAFDSILETFAYTPKYSWKPVAGGLSEFENDVIVSKEEGLIDIDFYIDSHTPNKDGSFLISAAGTLEEKAVGFSIRLDKKWTPKKIANSRQSFYWGTGAFISRGQVTKNFIEVLSGLYELSTPSVLDSDVDVVIVGLANDPRDLATKDIKMKLFFNSDSQDCNAEVYLNVNLVEKTLEFHEKDQEYRQPLIRSLCGES